MNMNATNEQLELGFQGSRNLNAAPFRGRIARANWWFTQMRDAVGQAIDWSAAADPRPEQIWMPGAHREVKI